MIALLARKLTLTVILALVLVALLEQVNPSPPPLAVEFHHADFPVCVTIRNGPLVPKKSATA